jgi:hypothetical protein
MYIMIRSVLPGAGVMMIWLNVERNNRRINTR